MMLHFPPPNAAPSEHDWPILDPVKLQAAFASLPSVSKYQDADRVRQSEIMMLWADRRANGDQFEQKAADTRIWFVECADRSLHALQREDFIDNMTEDATR